ncbi:MAG TPA: hypothetical protein VI757_09155 [Bacteroidia bacterium]|nr:hypothetical protein [Bacteroidia bacterium]
MNTVSGLKNSLEFENAGMVPHVWLALAYYEVVKKYKKIGLQDLWNKCEERKKLPYACHIFAHILWQLDYFGIVKQPEDGGLCYYTKDFTPDEIRTAITKHPFMGNISWFIEWGDDNYKLCKSYLDLGKFYMN